jgi:catechol 2,3-dioxygenase-like lactoylglutathione lyase family enzyme
MPSSDPSRPALLDIEPQIYVTDLPRALDFFTEKLGFSIAFQYGEPAFYGQVARDGARLNLRHLDAPLIPAELHAREPDLICAAIEVSNARQLFEEFAAAGVAFHQPPAAGALGRGGDRRLHRRRPGRQPDRLRRPHRLSLRLTANSRNPRCPSYLDMQGMMHENGPTDR